MAEQPEKVKVLIITKDINIAGIYLLKFFINGYEQLVIVDDYIPVVKGSNKLAFASAAKNEIWVSLLEKGWAKLHGSYSAITGGAPDFAACHLAGVPSDTFKHQENCNLDEFWEVLRSCAER